MRVARVLGDVTAKRLAANMTGRMGRHGGDESGNGEEKGETFLIPSPARTRKGGQDGVGDEVRASVSFGCGAAGQGTCPRA